MSTRMTRSRARSSAQTDSTPVSKSRTRSTAKPSTPSRARRNTKSTTRSRTKSPAKSSTKSTYSTRASRFSVGWSTEESNCDQSILDQEEEEEGAEIDATNLSTPENTDTEQSGSEDELDENDNSVESQVNTKKVFISKNGEVQWHSSPRNCSTRVKKHNIVRNSPGVKGVARNAKSPLECWQLFFDDDLLDEIVKCTNIYFDERRSRYKRARDVRPTCIAEIKALVGLLYMIGVRKGGYLNLEELWATDGTAPDFFRATMSLKRFYQLLAALRFDDINTRRERVKFDRLAPIRYIFDRINDRCKSFYTPGDNVVVDEMLERFRGKCGFRVYIPSKPGKYGLKVYALVDCRVFYTLNMEIYAGQQPNGPFQVPSSTHSLVKRITEPILNSGRNLTIDNFFTSIPVAQDLLRNHQTTVVGTLRKNKAEIPPEFKVVNEREVKSSLFGFTEECTLVSYVPKKKKNVLMLSTLHNDEDIDLETGDNKKPEIITFYNKTKGGVDVVDEMKANYSVSRVTRRWPMVIFYALLNIIGINAQIIHHENSGKKITRRNFLKDVGKALLVQQLQIRVQDPSLSCLLKTVIKKFADLAIEPRETEEQDGQMVVDQGFCALCPRRENKKTKKRCKRCLKFLCPTHSILYCGECEDGLFKDNDSDCDENV